MARKRPTEKKKNFDWTDEALNKVRLLWTEGHSTAEMGRRIGVSKNAIVGKVHRLDLPGRPSPIVARTKDPKPTRARVTLPPLPPLNLFTTVAVVPMRAPAPAPKPAPERVDSKPVVLSVLVSAPAPKPAPKVVESKPAVLVRAPIQAPKPEPEWAPRRPKVVPLSGVKTCQFPSGEPGKPNFRFCGNQPVVPGKPYCRGCCEIAYVRVKERNADNQDAAD